MLMPNFKCVQCGFCCAKTPCGFGSWDEVRGGCACLTEDNLCEKYEEILKDPSSKLSPAFGSGCCQPLFNERRREVLRKGFGGVEQLHGYSNYIIENDERMVELYDEEKNLIRKMKDQDYIWGDGNVWERD